MIADILTMELISDLYIKNFLLPFMPILSLLLATIIIGFVLNKILNQLYYFFLVSADSKLLAHKKVKVCCVVCKTKLPYNDLHNSDQSKI